MNRNANDFFAMLLNLATFSSRSAETLHKTLGDFDAHRLPELLQHMHSIEHAADVEKHTLMKKLAREFLPPIDREDIVDLSQEIDNVTDAVEEVLIRIYMYNISEIRSDALAISALVVKSCAELQRAVREFANFRKSEALPEAIVEINRLEEVGDKLYSEAVRKLFSGNKDPLKVIAWEKIFDQLELCCDACEHAANIIESILMKNS